MNISSEHRSEHRGNQQVVNTVVKQIVAEPVVDGRVNTVSLVTATPHCMLLHATACYYMPQVSSPTAFAPKIEDRRIRALDPRIPRSKHREAAARYGSRQSPARAGEIGRGGGTVTWEQMGRQGVGVGVGVGVDGCGASFGS